MKIAISCGGTGGHVFPGVATAAAIVNEGHEAAIILSGRNVEGARPEGWDGPILHVPFPPPRWRQPHTAILSACQLMKACFIAIRKFRQFRPDALLAMGSYTSFPTVIAARLLKIPVVLHEANAIPGKTITKLQPLARTVCIAFDEAAAHFPASTRTCNTGFPVRQSIANAKAKFDACNERFTVLIMGGSQGAAAVNSTVIGAVHLLASDPAEAPCYQFIHLAGTNNETDVRNAYSDVSSIPVEVIGFSENIGELYAAADFCLSRAGAASCFELRLRGLPAALIPLPSAARDHQMANARAMERLGGCDVIPQSTLTPESLADYLRTIRRDEAKRTAMQRILRKTATPDAAEKLADCVIACAKQ